jgi:hypothetical protein
MTRMRLMGMGVLVALAVSAVLAAGASAGEYNLKNLPEIGRCKPAAGGEFRGAKCTRAEPRGKYGWFSGPGAKAKFTGAVSEPIELRLRDDPNQTTVCAAGEVAGEYTGPKNLTITKLVLTNCHANGTCENKVGSTAGEITFEELVGELGFISHPKKLKLGWNLRPKSGSNLASYECGGMIVGGKSAEPGASREVQGAVIGTIEPIGKMLPEMVLVGSLDKHGNQLPEKFEGGVKDVLTTILGEKLPGTGKSSHATLFVAKLHLKSEESLEALGRCVGSGC